MGNDYFKQAVIAVLCDIAAGGGGGATVEGEPLVLCDTVQEFLRHFTYTNGVVTAVVNTELDGVTPYVPVGAVALCAPVVSIGNPVPYAAPADTQQADTGEFSSVADQVLFPAVVGMRNYVTTLTLSNSSLVLTRFLIKDGATVIHSVYVDAQVAVVVVLPVPLRGSVNTDINVATAAAVTNALVSGVGYLSAV